MPYGNRSLTGAGTLSTLAAATTHAVGTIMIDHFESGGTLQDFDRQLLRQHLHRERAGVGVCPWRS